MYDGASLSDPNRLQRAVGGVRLAAKRFGEETVINDLRQEGCLKARFPRPAVSGWLDAVLLNTGGGVAAGDRLEVAVEAEAGARLIVSAQAAERFYRARAGESPARVTTTIRAAADAAVEWLPQETILFDRSALDRRLTIELAPDARFLGLETLVFGRKAMGETVRHGWLRDQIQIRRGGELLLHDAIRVEGDVEATLAGTATAGGATVLATLIYSAPDAAAHLEDARAALGAAEAGASVWHGIMVVRILGRESAAVRATTVAVLDVLRDGRPLPRVWLC